MLSMNAKSGRFDVDVPVYKAGQSAAGQIPVRHNLAANESALGISELARQAYINQAAAFCGYPVPDAAMLREALAAHHQLESACIVCSNGSEEALHLLARASVRAGDEVIISRHGFIVHKIASLAAGGMPVVVAENNLRCDVDAMLAAVTERTRLLFIANPGNPSGTYLPLTELQRLHKGLPENVLLVIDSAYAEFAEEREDYDSGIALIRAGADNVAVTRSFSKMYGLAGLRVGWCYCSRELAAHLHKIRPVFNVNVAAQAAAIAALQDSQYFEDNRRLNRQERERIRDKLAELGLSSSDSVANFVLVDCSRANKDATAMFRFLQEAGILVRTVAEYGLPDSLRISVGRSGQNSELLSVIEKFMLQ